MTKSAGLAGERPASGRRPMEPKRLTAVLTKIVDDPSEPGAMRHPRTACLYDALRPFDPPAWPSRASLPFHGYGTLLRRSRHLSPTAYVEAPHARLCGRAKEGCRGWLAGWLRSSGGASARALLLVASSVALFLAAPDGCISGRAVVRWSGE